MSMERSRKASSREVMDSQVRQRVSLVRTPSKREWIQVELAAGGRYEVEGEGDLAAWSCSATALRR
jgi:hypothetical protein